MSNVTMLMIVFLLFILVALFWYQLLNICTEESMVASAITIMLTVFICGLNGNAYMTYQVIFYIAVAGVFLFLLNIGNARIKIGFIKRIARFFSPSVIIMTIIFVYSIIFFQGALFTYEDELSQWGPAIRYMCQTGLLPYGTGFSGDSVNFSISTMFQYYFSGFGTFVESNAYVGNFLLAFIPVLLPCRKIGWEKWKVVFLYAGVTFFVLNLLSCIRYYTILQDYVLPMWTGGTIAWLLWRGKEKINYFLFFAILTIIAAMKHLMGPLLACMVILTAFLVMYFRNTDKNLNGWRKLRGIFSLKYLSFIPLFTTPVLFPFIWSHIISTNIWDGIYDVSMQKDALQVIWKMCYKVFSVLESTTSNMFSVSYIVYVVLYAVGIGALLKIVNDGSGMIKTIYSLYIAGAFLYLCILFYAYMTIFGVRESQTVAGFERYVSYYMLIGIPALLFPAFYHALQIKRSSALKSVAILIMVICMYGTKDSFMEKATIINCEDNRAWRSRVEIKQKAEQIKLLVQEQKKVFIIGKLDTELAKMYAYELENQYAWEKDSYTIDTTDGETVMVLDVASYPELLTETDCKYVLFVEPKEKEEEYDRLRYYYGFESVKDGELYEIIETGEKYEFRYVGFIADNG